MLVSALAVALGLGGLGLGGVAGPPAEAHNCALCVHFVTTFDPDGTAGPRTGRIKLQDGVLVNVPYALDVNGDQPPVPLGVLPALPGYEISVTVLATSAERPTITVNKLLNAPLKLPLKVEAFSGPASGPAKKTTFGYDTRDSSAPGSFRAEIDLRDTDQNPATTNAALDVTISQAASSLTLVNEEFTGGAGDGRKNRTIRRFTFRDGPSGKVPHNAGLVLTASDTKTDVRLTSSARSIGEFELLDPDGSETTGSISDLPSSTHIVLTKADVDADGFDDTLVDYFATHRVGHAEVHIFDGISGILTEARLDNLPREAHLVYGDPPGKTHIEYRATERAGRAQIDVTGGDTELRAIMENLPTEISDLTYTTAPSGGTVVYHADARADLVQVEVREENRELIALANTVPQNIDELTYSTVADHLGVDYLADAITPHVEVSVDDLIQGTFPDPDHRRKIVATADAFAKEFHFDLNTPSNAETTVDYTASDSITRVHVTEDDEEPVLARAKALDLTLEALPLSLHGAFGQDTVLVDALGGKIGKAEFLAQRERPASPGPDPLGDPEQDGLFLDDDPEGTDAYVLLARVHDLQKVDSDTSPNLDALLDTDSDPLRSFDINLHYPTADFNETQRLTGSIDTLRPSTQVFVGAENADTDLISYDDEGSGNGPTINLDGQNLEALPAGANGVQAEEIHVDLVGMPRHLAYRHATDASLPEEERNGLPMDVETTGGTVDRADIQLTSGPDERLPEAANGFYMRDLNDKFVIFARARNLDSFHTDRPTDDQFDLSLDAPDAGPVQLDVVKGVSDQLWESFSTRPGIETIAGDMASLPANLELHSLSTSDPVKKEITYTADDTAASFNFSDVVNYSGPELEQIVDYMNSFLNDHAPTNFEPSDFDSSQTLSLTPMPSFFHVCQVATGNECTSDVFTGSDFSEFSPTSANGGSIRFQASPRTHFSFHDSSPKATEFWYNRVNEEPPNGCQAGEQPGPNTTDPSEPLDCEGKDVKPGRATADIELDLNELAIQSHQEDAGFVGSLIGYPDQGYVAMDTGWESDFVSCVDSLTELGSEDPEGDCGSLPFSLFHGHHFAPLDQRVTGDVEKGGSLNMPSEGSASWMNDFDRISGIIDTVDLHYGEHLALDHRVFEGDPDELIFAKTASGHSYCEDDTVFNGGGSDFTDDFCGYDELAFHLGDPP